jgi:uncharacterized protein YcfL
MRKILLATMMSILAIVLMGCSQPKEINNDGVYAITKDNRTLITIDTDQGTKIRVYKDMVCFIENGYQYYTCSLDAELEKRD